MLFGLAEAVPADRTNQQLVVTKIEIEDADELGKAPNEYEKFAADICGDLPPHIGSFDLILTKMLLIIA